MSDLLIRQKYALLRRRGYSDRKAANRAGYSGRPGPEARRLIELVDEEAGGNLASRRVELEQELEVLEFKRKEAQLRLEAVEALLEEQS